MTLSMQLPESIPTLWILIGVGVALVLVLLMVLLLRLKYRSEAALLGERYANTQTELDAAGDSLQQRDQELTQLRTKAHETQVELAHTQAQLTSLQHQVQDLQARYEQAQQIAETLKAENTAGKQELSRAQTQLTAERKQAEEKLAVLQDAKERMTAEFKNLANEIFEDKSQRFTEQNKQNLETLLQPFSGQLKDFKKQVESSYEKESKDRFSLVQEIKNLQDLNSRISTDAVNLTKALKGESKTQGAWGELSLERILEASGLTKGREYDVQLSIKGESGARLQPDVVVHLPEQKDVIVDSKVTLTAYHSYISAQSEEEREVAAKAHLQSLHNHLRGLSSKDYQNLPGLQTLDFVLMFLPIEDAFNLAVQRDPELYAKAFGSNIILVGPSTLLATLRTIQHIWRNEYQSRNAQEIARRAGDLYDKFANFVADIEEVGQRLDKAQDAYHKAHNKLSSGRGNLVARAETLKKLGAKASKQLPKALVQNSGEVSEESARVIDMTADKPRTD